MHWGYAAAYRVWNPSNYSIMENQGDHIQYFFTIIMCVYQMYILWSVLPPGPSRRNSPKLGISGKLEIRPMGALIAGVTEPNL